MVESVKEVIFQLDEAGRWVFLNRSWADLTGYAVEDTLGRDCIDYVHADDREHHIEVLERVEAVCRRGVIGHRADATSGPRRWTNGAARR